jgi:hypothetical protein
MKHVCDAALLSKDAATDAYTMLDVMSADTSEMRSRVSRTPFGGGSGFSHHFDPDPRFDVDDHYDLGLNLNLTYDYNLKFVGRFDEKGWKGALFGKVSRDGR